MVTLTYMLRMLRNDIALSNAGLNTDYFIESVAFIIDYQKLRARHAYVLTEIALETFNPEELEAEDQSVLFIISNSMDTLPNIPNCTICMLRGNGPQLGNKLLSFILDNSRMTERLIEFKDNESNIPKLLDKIHQLTNSALLFIGQDRQILHLAGNDKEWMPMACEETVELLKKTHPQHYFLTHLRCGIRIHCKPIISHNKTIAYLVFLCTKDQDADYKYILEFASSIIAHKIVSFGNEEHHDLNRIIDDILNDRLCSNYAIYDALRGLQNPPVQAFIPLLIRISDYTSIHYDYLLSRLKSIFPASNMCIYQGDILIIDNQISPYEFDAHEDEIEELLSGYSAFMVVSSGLYSPDKLKDALDLMFHAANIAKRLNHASSKKHIIHVNEYKTYCLIDTFASAYEQNEHTPSFFMLAAREVYLIACYDQTFSSDYLDVMYAYLINNHSLTKASKQLHMHKNTITYKLNKIKTIIGKELPDGEEQFQYILSYYLCKYSKTFLNESFSQSPKNFEWIHQLEEPF